MNKSSVYIKNGWINFLCDDGEMASFRKDDIVMTKALPQEGGDTRLMIETAGSSKVQVHYFKHREDVMAIRELILSE